jgi:hypothetical protein
MNLIHIVELKDSTRPKLGWIAVKAFRYEIKALDYIRLLTAKHHQRGIGGQFLYRSTTLAFEE